MRVVLCEKFVNMGSMKLIKNEGYNVCQCQIIFYKKTPKDILQLIKIVIENIRNKNLNEELKINLVLGKRTHRIMAAASFLEKVEYLNMIGIKDDITSIDGFSDAISFYRLNKELKKFKINNDIFKKTKRIHAVHPVYVYHDPEISGGLRISALKHPNDGTLYVNSVPALETALKICENDTTLVIDGHWVHDSSSIHGVWDECDADTLSNHIAHLVNQYSDKIVKINLLGCESGTLRDDLDESISPNRLYIRDKIYNDQDAGLAEFRKRVVYISDGNESIFDKKSLAYNVIKKLNNKSISVSATPRLGYPYPPECARINIASDASSWDQKHFWEENKRSHMYNFCRNTKSTTQQTQPLNEKEYKNYVKIKPNLAL